MVVRGIGGAILIDVFQIQGWQSLRDIEKKMSIGWIALLISTHDSDGSNEITCVKSCEI